MECLHCLLDGSPTIVAAVVEPELNPSGRLLIIIWITVSEGCFKRQIATEVTNHLAGEASHALRSRRRYATLDVLLPELIEADSMFGRSAAPLQSVVYKSPFIVLLSYWKASKLISLKKSKGVGGNLSSWVLFNYPSSEGCWIITDITHTRASHLVFQRRLSCSGRARRCASTWCSSNSLF